MNHTTLKKRDINKDGALLALGIITENIISKTSLRHSFVIADCLWVYEPHKGIYERMSDKDLEGYLIDTFEQVGALGCYTRALINNLSWNLTAKIRKKTKGQAIDYDYITFRNGHFNLKTLKLEPLSPEIRSVSFIDALYDPKAQPVMWLKFLRSQFTEDMIVFLKAAISSILRADNRAQVFISLLGPGGTGKSTLVNIITLLVGENATVTTTLRHLNFEGSNLLGKRLIVINDTQGFKGDLQVLKNVTGGDSIQGRTKFLQGSFEVRPRGFVVISGNQPLLTKQTSEALARRLRVLPMRNRPDKIEYLLYKQDDAWKGPMVEETSGIVNWAFEDMPADKATKYLRDINLTPSLMEDHQSAVRGMNPLINWVSEELEPADGSYLGFTTNHTPEALLHSVRQLRTLYPCYLLYCKRSGSRPLGRKTFVSDLLSTCDTMGLKVSKKHMRLGTFIFGIAIKSHVLEADYQAGAPMTSDDATEIIETSLEAGSSDTPQEGAKEG